MLRRDEMPAAGRGGEMEQLVESAKILQRDFGKAVRANRTAEVPGVGGGRVAFRLEDSRRLEPGAPGSATAAPRPRLGVHRARVPGGTVDNVIAAIGARHPHLTTQKSVYVEISRARERAERVTDDAAGLRAQLQAATGERIAALEGIGQMARGGPERASEAGRSPAKASAKAMGNAVAGGRSGTDSQTAEPNTAARVPGDAAVAPGRTWNGREMARRRHGSGSGRARPARGTVVTGGER